MALAEVTGPPVETAAPDAADYDLKDEVTSVARRVPVRFYRPARGPLWLEDDDEGVLRALGVVRARGGTVFKVTLDEWGRVMQALGGWPGGPSPAGRSVEGVRERPSMKTYRKVLDPDTTLVLSTESELFRFLDSSTGARPGK